jgi:DNA-binding transcriptional ArsR family regulator
MTHDDTRYVTDVASLKAIAHPLRVRLLGALRIYGPATATELAKRLGESSGSTSYHLRQLARYGYVAEAPEQPNARDRRWQAVHRYTNWSPLATDPEGAETTRWLRDRQRRAAARVAEAFEAGEWSDEWRTVAGQSDLIVRLTPASLGALSERFLKLAEQYAARDADNEDAADVALYLSGFPITEYPV